MLERITSGGDKLFQYYYEVKYFETDAMRIVHHSNYVHWMESARLNYLHWVNLDYDLLEQHGVASPVVDVYLKYKAPSKFGDIVRVDLACDYYDSLKFTFAYKMYVEDKLICVASSKHCMINMETGKLVKLDDIWPDKDRKFKDFLLGEAKQGNNLHNRTTDSYIL